MSLWSEEFLPGSDLEVSVKPKYTISLQQRRDDTSVRKKALWGDITNNASEHQKSNWLQLKKEIKKNTDMISEGE